MALETFHSEELGDVRFSVFRDGKGNFIAYSRELDLPACGSTYEDAVCNFGEVLRLYVECCEESGTLQADLARHGVNVTQVSDLGFVIEIIA